MRICAKKAKYQIIWCSNKKITGNNNNNSLRLRRVTIKIKNIRKRPGRVWIHGLWVYTPSASRGKILKICIYRSRKATKILLKIRQLSHSQVPMRSENLCSQIVSKSNKKSRMRLQQNFYYPSSLSYQRQLNYKEHNKTI